MSQDDRVEITKRDVEGLAGKLETFAATLNAEEQAILSHVLTAAAKNTNEVSGYATLPFGPGIASDLGMAIGYPGTDTGPTAKKGSLFLACAKGEHFKDATITH